MPLRLQVVGTPGAAANLRGGAAAVALAATDTVRLAAREAGTEAAKYTASKYNLDEEVVGNYISVDDSSELASTITLKVRGVPLEDFNPQITMKKFTFIDSRGRHYSRLLPAVYFSTLRGGKTKLLRPAFPLTTRTSGGLAPGDVIRRRIGKARGRLTRIRFYTFPSKFLRTDLVPHLQDTIGNVAAVHFKGAFRARNGSLRQPR